MVNCKFKRMEEGIVLQGFCFKVFVVLYDLDLVERGQFEFQVGEKVLVRSFSGFYNIVGEGFLWRDGVEGGGREKL